jgi:NAD(P)H-hydrate repair Nnr-like enzyme with NAD(P)H-hydrate dehydratase domain
LTSNSFVPECGYEILQIAIPEVMVITDVQRYLSDIKFQIKPQAIGIGPGIGQEQVNKKALHRFLISNTTPLVLDADALNCIV